jgi:hypothetical protein
MVIVVCRIGHRGFAIGRYKSITQYFEINRTTNPALFPVYRQFKFISEKNINAVPGFTGIFPCFAINTEIIGVPYKSQVPFFHFLVQFM